jgi:hypothetical protein
MQMTKNKPAGGIVWALPVVAVILITAFSFSAKAQTNLETFGQNRVQYRKFDWRFFETEHFRIYHYDAAGRTLARYVSEQVENDIKVVEEKIGGQFPRRFKIIIYNSYDEYRQTNIGRKFDADAQGSPAGTVNLVGDKLVVYFTGEHTDLRRQTREGMSRVVMERMLFGETFREMVKNAVLMNLPSWTVNGFLAYLVDGWDTETNSRWKNMIDAHPKKGFHELSEMDPELAGKAFWKYIADRYGDNDMKNLLYNMQLKTSLSMGIKMSLGQKVKETYDSVMNFYKDVYAAEALVKELPDTSASLIDIDVPEDGSVIRDIKVAPRGNDVAYVQWKNGEYKIIVQKTKNQQERAVILEGGRTDYNELPDPNYPLMAWANNGLKLGILYKKGTQTRLRIYNSLKAKLETYVIPANRFDRVLGMTFMEDDAKLVFSAVKKSQTDLYEFTIRGSKMKNITNDAWDDVQPWFVSGGSRKGILFLSNRPQANLIVPIGVNELPVGPMNVFFYNTKTQRKELLQMSRVKAGNVTQPIQYGSDNYAYLYDANGVQNKFVVLLGRDSKNMDSFYSVPVTNYTQNIISHQYNPASNQVADVLQVGGKYHVYFKELQLPGVNVQPKILTPTILGSSEYRKKPASVSYVPSADGQVYQAPTQTDNSIMKSGNVFQSEFGEDTTVVAPVAAREEPAPETPGATEAAAVKITDESLALEEENDSTFIKVDSSYIKMKPQPYRLSFKPNFFSVRVDNSVLFNRYQSVNNGGYANPSLGGMITVTLDDLMENHRFTGGIRLPINFSGMTYYLRYENFKRRLDWEILYLRTQNYTDEDVAVRDSANNVAVVPLLLKKNSTIIQGGISYPFDRVRSVRLYLGGRQDQLTVKAQDRLGLAIDPVVPREYWALSRAEYVFDNTTRPAMNIFNGFRYKFYAEYLYRLNAGNGGFYNLGLDFRHYQKLYKNIIWANRLAGAHSGGDMKILYLLGGVDNWLMPQYSHYVPVRPLENYAFQALATNMRGYLQNGRNGNTYAVLNSEVRVPVFATFLKRPVQSSVLRNMQFVAFTDAGSAWNGLLPNADALRNDNFFPGRDVDLQVIDQTGGLALGYGVGLRSTIFGYFVRADAAWNIEGGRKPIIYLSFGTDF